jgi:SAM-dependent methyltransferase
MPTDPRYEKFGWDYGEINPLGEDEVAWHLRHARETGGPVLGLACGTGRLLARLADEGFDVTGLDLSETMLQLARRETKGRVRLIRGNMSDFHLGREFGLVLIADNSFRELETREQLLGCLRCIREHLCPDGRLLITERRFDPAKFPGGRREFGWSEPKTNPAGESVRRRGEIALVDGGRRIRGKFIYETTRADGSVTIDECAIDAPILLTGDYLRLFDEAGFRAQVFAGYEGAPDDGKSALLCFVCEKAE